MRERDTWELTREMFLSEDEVQTVRRSLQSQIDHAEEVALWAAKTDQLIFELLTFSGIRNSEFCRLRLADVPPAMKLPTLRVVGTPRQDRDVAIPEVLVKLVSDYIRIVRPNLLRDSKPIKGLEHPLILNERGRPFDRTTLYRRVVRILAAAGFESRASVQLLRHTYGYLAYKRTQGNLLFVQQQLGHSHPMVTAVYAEFVKFSPTELADLVGGSTADTFQKPLSKRIRKGTP